MEDLNATPFDMGGTIDVLFEFMSPVGVEYLTQSGTLPRSRLEMAHEIVDAALREVTAPCTLVFTAELVDTVNSRQQSGGYTLERGANTVNARTMQRDDGSYEIITGAEWLLELPEATDAEANLRSRLLAHTVAHEAQHVILMSTGRETQRYAEKVDLSPTEQSVLPGLAINLDEYRCEVAANRIVPTGGRVEDLADQLKHFRKEMNASRVEILTDIRVGATRALTACMDLWKGLSYAIAERVDDREQEAMAAPVPPIRDWELLAGVWPVAVQIHRLVPAANEEADAELTTTALELLCKAFVLWMESAGLVLKVDDDDVTSCYWLREEY